MSVGDHPEIPSSSESPDSEDSGSIEVTSISASRKRGQQFDVRSGRRILVTLPWDDIEALDIRQGVIWSPELAERAAERAEMQDAIRAAVRWLERRPMAQRDIEFRLRKKGFGERAIRQATERLVDLRYIDDESCARQWIDHFLRSKPTSRRMIEQKLRAKHLDGELVRRLLAESVDHAAEEEMARRVAEKKWRSLQHRESTTRAGRLYRYLAGRGFHADLCRRIVNDLSSGEACDLDS